MLLALSLDVSHIIAAVVGALAAQLLRRLFVKPEEAKTCPSCSEPLPIRRRPKSLRQAVRGGWTCPSCGAELDRHAQPLA